MDVVILVIYAFQDHAYCETIKELDNTYCIEPVCLQVEARLETTEYKKGGVRRIAMYQIPVFNKMRYFSTWLQERDVQLLSVEYLDVLTGL